MMEVDANEDAPEDVKRASSVIREVRKGEKDDTFEGYRYRAEKKRKLVHCDKTGRLRSKQKASPDVDCCPGKRERVRRKPEKFTKVSVFGEPCTFPKLDIVPRHCLKKQEYIDMLATPSRKCPPECDKKDVIRRVRPVSQRIKELAQPTRQRMLITLQERATTLPAALLDNLVLTLEQETCLTPEQAARVSRSKKPKKRKKEPKPDSQWRGKETTKRPRKGSVASAGSLDRDAVSCQYQIAERFVKSLLKWRCPIPRKEFRDIAEVVNRRLLRTMEWSGQLSESETRESQQTRFLADVVACWIAGVLTEVAEDRRQELEEMCKKLEEEAKAAEDDEDEEEDDDEDWGAPGRKEEPKDYEDEDEEYYREEMPVGKPRVDKEEKREKLGEGVKEEEEVKEEEAKEEEAKEEEVKEEDVKEEELKVEGEPEVAADQPEVKVDPDVEQLGEPVKEEFEQPQTIQEEPKVETDEPPEPTVEPEMEQAPTKEPEVEPVPIEEPEVEQVPIEEPKVEQVPIEEPKVEQVPIEEPKVEQVPIEEPEVEQVPIKEETKTEDETAKQDQIDAEKEKEKMEEQPPGLDEGLQLETAPEPEAQPEMEPAVEEVKVEEPEEIEVPSATLEEEPTAPKVEEEPATKPETVEEPIITEEEAKEEIPEAKVVDEPVATKPKDEAEKVSKEPETGELTRLDETLKAIGIAETFRSELPFLTCDKIIDTLYKMVESLPENDGKDPTSNRIHRAIYERLYRIVEMENPKLLTEQLKDLMDVTCGKIAIWLRNALTKSQIDFMERYVPEVESMEIREWLGWLLRVSDVADNWNLWLRAAIEKIQGLQGVKVTRGEWEDWTRSVDAAALLWRRFHLQTVHQAHRNASMLTARKVVKTGTKNPGFPRSTEELVQVTDLHA